MWEQPILRKSMNNQEQRTRFIRLTMNVKTLSKTAGLLLLALILASCRGQLSEKPPVHPNMNMDQQPRKEGQEVNEFFTNNMSMRQPVEGTVARGHLKDDPVYYEGINPDSSFVEEIPVELTKSFLYRGQGQYEIYCAPCHGIAGDGQGIIMTGQYGYVPAPSYHIDRIRNLADGELYSAIANGIRTMPSYAHQVPVRDRWAIVAYIRALQRSQNVPEEDMTEYNVDLAELNRQYQQEQEALAEKEAARQQAGGEVSAARGEEIFTNQGCQACHSRDGSDGIGPTHQNIFGRTETLTDGSTVTVDEAYIRESIVNPSAKIVEGYQPVMAPYGHLGDDEIQSLIEYLKSISENQ